MTFKLRMECEHYRSMIEREGMFAGRFICLVEPVKKGVEPAQHKLRLRKIAEHIRTIERGECPCWKAKTIDERCVALAACPFGPRGTPQPPASPAEQEPKPGGGSKPKKERFP